MHLLQNADQTKTNPPNAKYVEENRISFCCFDIAVQATHQDSLRALMYFLMYEIK